MSESHSDSYDDDKDTEKVNASDKEIIFAKPDLSPPHRNCEDCMKQRANNNS